MGEDIAYEVMSYVALDTDYLQGLMERGYNETIALLRDKTDVTFQKQLSYKAIADELVKA